MLRRFALIAVALAASLSFATPAFARDVAAISPHDDIASQISHTPRDEAADAILFADATGLPAVTITTPTTTVVAPDPNVVGPVTMIIMVIFAGLSTVLGWAIRKLGTSWGVSASSTILSDLAGLADNALDLAHAKVTTLVVPIAADKLHGTIVEEAFDILWPIGSKQIAKLGWSEDTVKVWLSSLLAPATKGTSVTGVTVTG